MGREGERKQMIRITTIITRIITADAANFKDLQEFTHEILKLIYLCTFFLFLIFSLSETFGRKRRNSIFLGTKFK